tara:strand:+ start:2254 stop:3351 length:1098 start_codon:yes stop_codon:yes gene_type:complete
MLLDQANKYIALAEQCGEGKKYPKQEAVATELGLTLYQFKSRLKQARSLVALHKAGKLNQDAKPDVVDKHKAFETPLLPNEDMELPDLLEHMVRRYKKRDKAKKASNWVKVKVNFESPFMLVLVGDPHVDDNYFNAPKWMRDIAIVQNNKPYIRSVLLGDNANFWIGRLKSIYQDQEVTVSHSYRLIQHMFSKEGFDPLIAVNGNHDLWVDRGGDPLKFMEESKGVVQGDWTIKFKLCFPNGKEMKIIASHDFPGHSQWNPLHSNLKASMMGVPADLYCSGHKHNWAIMNMPIMAQDRTVWLIRARGYKQYDDYANRLGYEPDYSGVGESVGVVIDPNADKHNWIKCFADIEHGAEYLDFLRNRK